MSFRKGLAFTAAGLAGLLAVASGGQDLGGRVVGGVDAAEGKWPYQVYIAVDEGGTFACGGTLISPQWVLTAAHCTVSPRSRQPFAAASYSVRIGSSVKSSGGTLRRVRRVIAHEQYGTPRPLENDIALLELDQPAPATTAALEGTGGVRVATDASPWARVIGWGLTSGTSRTSAAERLQEAPLPLVDNARCDAAMRQMIPEAGPIDTRRICAGQSEGGVDSCNGDSGGPLLALGADGRWAQIGIVSYGVEDCGRAGAYGVYTRVSAFVPWIAQRTGLPLGGGGTSAPLQLGINGAAPTLIAQAARNDGQVSVTVLPKAMKLGEPFRVSVTSAVDGYLALFDVSPDNKVLQVFPNPRSRLANRDGRIAAGQTITLPDPSYGFEFRAAEPVGRGRLIAVVARDPAALSAAVRAEDGFKSAPDGNARMARLEVVMKPVGSGAGEQRAPAGVAAALSDYIVR